MPLEAIKQVTQSEEQAETRRAIAQTEATRIIADAQKDAQLLTERVTREGEEYAKEQLTAAETRAATHTQEVLRQAQADCATLCQAAEGKLGDAARLITRKGVTV